MLDPGREKERHTAHDCSYTGDEVDDLGLDTGVWAGAKGRVIGCRREVY
jgi:hypothetical protein